MGVIRNTDFLPRGSGVKAGLHLLLGGRGELGEHRVYTVPGPLLPKKLGFIMSHDLMTHPTVNSPRGSSLKGTVV